MQDQIKAVREFKPPAGGIWYEFEKAIRDHAGEISSDTMMTIVRELSQSAVVIACGCRTVERDGEWSIGFCDKHGASEREIDEVKTRLEVMHLENEKRKSAGANLPSDKVVSLTPDQEIDVES